MNDEQARALQRTVRERRQAQERLLHAENISAVREAATEYVSACSEHARLTYEAAQRMGLEA